MTNSSNHAKHQCKIIKKIEPKILPKQPGIKNFITTPKTSQQVKKREPPTPPEKEVLAKRVNMSQQVSTGDNTTVGDNNNQSNSLLEPENPENPKLSPELQHL